jgi:hypothetical protein
MLNKKSIGCASIALVVIVLGIVVNFKPPKFSAEGQQALDDFIRRFEGPGFGYSLVSIQKVTVQQFDATSVDRISNFAGYGGEQRPAGICPGGDLVKETWCVIVDNPVETPAGDSFTHFILQRQNQLWFVTGVTEVDADMFQAFQCKW